MKILVDEMPVCKDDCWFSDKSWVDGKWKPYCTLGADGVTDCDLENGECSKLHSFQSRLMTTADKGINSGYADRKTEPRTCSVNGRPYIECSDCEHFRCMADDPQTEREGE